MPRIFIIRTYHKRQARRRHAPRRPARSRCTAAPLARHPNRPRPTVNIPATPPGPRTRSASRAAAATRTVPRTVNDRPVNPVTPGEQRSDQKERPGNFAGTGIRQVHDRSITSPRQVHDRLRPIQSLTVDTGNLYGMTPRLAATSRSGHSTARHSACWSSIPAAATHARSSSPWRLDEMARADPAAGHGRGYDHG